MDESVIGYSADGKDCQIPGHVCCPAIFFFLSFSTQHVPTSGFLIGPLRIDVTVTARWPLWVLRNVTPFTPSHFRQSSEQIFLVLVFVFLKTVFLEFVFNAL